jgi:hypothetical protein
MLTLEYGSAQKLSTNQLKCFVTRSYILHITDSRNLFCYNYLIFGELSITVYCNFIVISYSYF